jgi:hypothetical protein
LQRHGRVVRPFDGEAGFTGRAGLTGCARAQRPASSLKMVKDKKNINGILTDKWN